MKLLVKLEFEHLTYNRTNKLNSKKICITISFSLVKQIAMKPRINV
jgi:hypothetical protein